MPNSHKAILSWAKIQIVMNTAASINKTAKPTRRRAAGPEPSRREQCPPDVKAAVFGSRPAMLLRQEQRHPHADGAVGDEGHGRDESRHHCAVPQVGQE